mgnify:FL=1
MNVLPGTINIICTKEHLSLLRRSIVLQEKIYIENNRINCVHSEVFKIQVLAVLLKQMTLSLFFLPIIQQTQNIALCEVN